MYVVCFINVNNYKNNLWKTLYLKLSTFIFVLGNPVNSTVYGAWQAHDRLVSDIAVDCLSLCVIRLFVALPLRTPMLIHNAFNLIWRKKKNHLWLRKSFSIIGKKVVWFSNGGATSTWDYIPGVQRGLLPLPPTVVNFAPKNEEIM